MIEIIQEDQARSAAPMYLGPLQLFCTQLDQDLVIRKKNMALPDQASAPPTRHMPHLLCLDWGA